MKTKIYDNYKEFLNREDKSLNGVSHDFVEANPNYVEMNKTNEGCWNCTNCTNCLRCSDCEDCHNCYACTDCTDCYACTDCTHCTGCRNCYASTDCTNCHNCWNNTNLNQKACSPEDLPPVPKVENIHQRVYEAASQPEALNMLEWHTCETTHCRAGWVVHLAGEAGYKLEEACDTARAALLIYEASSPIPVHYREFFEEENVALESMKKAAEAEKKLNEGES